MRKKQEGFSLYEILVVMVIIGLLIFSSLAVTTQLKKARDGRRKADLEKIKISLYDYFFDENCFPPALPACGEDLKVGETIYLNNFPCDPQGKNYGYQVEEGGCSQWFKVLTNLENPYDQGIVRVGCHWGCGPKCEYNYGLSSSNIRVNDRCVTYYACSPSRQCIKYEDPVISSCPRVFENDPTCQNACEVRENRCHDERGKRVPDEQTHKNKN